MGDPERSAALLAPGAPRPRGRPNVFDRPTDVAWDSQGNIFVSERNTSRIAKFTKTGSWIKAWGQFGTGPGEFNLPHVLAVDAEMASMLAIARTTAFRSLTPRAHTSGNFVGWARPGPSV